MPSLGSLARLGVPVGGRVRKFRAVQDLENAEYPLSACLRISSSKKREAQLIKRETRYVSCLRHRL